MVRIWMIALLVCLGAGLTACANEPPRRGPLGLLEWNGYPSVPYPSCPWPGGRAVSEASVTANETPTSTSIPTWLLVTGSTAAGLAVLGGLAAGFVSQWRSTHYAGK